MNDAPTEGQLFDSKVEVYARMLASQRGFNPDQRVSFGEPKRISLNGGFGFIAPEHGDTSPIWQHFISDVHAALAIMDMLPGQSDRSGE